MTYLTERFLQKPILRSQFLGLALISLVLIALQAAPASAQWTTPDASNNIHNTNTGGNVGIGTASPTGTLEVQGAGQNNTLRVISTNPVSGGLYFQNTQTTGQAVTYLDNNRGSFASYGGLLYGSSANALGNLLGVSRADRLFVFADGASNLGMAVGTLGAQPFILGTNNAEKMRIDASGNVGIGTTSPSASYKLDVNGGINTSGNVNVTGTGNINAVGTITGGNIVAKYQDVAEWVPASEQIPAGTVVVLDSTKSNQVISSSQAYDTRVAGVVSAQPGIALGERGDNKVLVATTGRVRIKVDASQAPIQVGDLLVTSDKAGVAMKSQPLSLGGVQIHRPGTLIGKALEPLAKGEDEILVLLSLQ
jgi:hypothetical protein